MSEQRLIVSMSEQRQCHHIWRQNVSMSEQRLIVSMSEQRQHQRI
jgi:hypothetical protein